MTVLHAIDGNNGETMTEASARRLRGALAERRMSARQLSSLLGMSYTWMSVRVNGKKSMSIDELEAIERATGISAAYLITGTKNNRRPDGPDGGGSSRTYSNPKIAHRIAAPRLAVVSGAVAA